MGQPKAAQRLAKTGIEVAEDLKISRAAVAVFDDEGKLLALEVLNENPSQAERGCQLKVQALRKGLNLREVRSTGRMLSLMGNLILGRGLPVQGAAHVEGLGFISVITNGNSTNDVQVADEALRKCGYRVRGGQKFEEGKPHVFIKPGWASYAKRHS